MHTLKIIVLLIFLPISLCAYTNEKIPAIEIAEFQPVTTSTITGVEWARLCINQYPEILFLANAHVRKTEEGKASLQDAYSEQLFGEKFIEFDRTIMTLHCLRLILDGSDTAYQTFTQAQSNDVKLTQKSFNTLHEQSKFLLQSIPQMSQLEVLQSMEAALVLGDIGKSEKARELFNSYGAKAPDHDDFHEEVLHILHNHPKLSPTFNRLSPAAKKLLNETANLAHYGHITHIEGGPNMFSKLQQRTISCASQNSLLFDFFIHTCDVAGALGHVNNQSSLVYTEHAHLAMQGVFASCAELITPHKTEIDAYNAYLALRASWLGLNTKSSTDRVLTRIGAMLRLFTPKEGTLLTRAFSKLSPEIQAYVIQQLDMQKDTELTRTPTYMPAVLVNLVNNPDLGASKEERISQTVILGLPFIARVLDTRRKCVASLKANASIPLNFNKAAGVAKTTPFALTGKYIIDSEGNVCVK